MIDDIDFISGHNRAFDGAALNREARKAGLCLLDIDGGVRVVGYRGAAHKAPDSLMDTLVEHRKQIVKALVALAEQPTNTDTAALALLDRMDQMLSGLRMALDAALAGRQINDHCWQTLSAQVEDIGMLTYSLHGHLQDCYA